MQIQASFEIVYFEKENGDVPVRTFLENLADPRHKAKLLLFIDFLRERNVFLREPHVKKLEGKIWELRVPHGRAAYRVLFFYEGREIVLTHAFEKKTAKTPREELERANQHRSSYLKYRNRYPRR